MLLHYIHPINSGNEKVGSFMPINQPKLQNNRRYDHKIS